MPRVNGAGEAREQQCRRCFEALGRAVGPCDEHRALEAADDASRRVGGQAREAQASFFAALFENRREPRLVVVEERDILLESNAGQRIRTNGQEPTDNDDWRSNVS
jgi:hypothetical protein